MCYVTAVAIAALFGQLALGVDPYPQPVAEDVVQFALDSNKFGADLLAHLDNNRNANLILSPNCIMSVMALTVSGARGETQRQMAAVLHFTLPAPRLQQASVMLQHALQTENSQKPSLRISTRMWLQRGLKLQPSFRQLATATGEIMPGELDFARQPEAARSTINGWVEEQTAQRIKNMLPSGIVDSETRLILTSALYFKQNWTHAFDKKETSDAVFHVSAEREIRVPMMHRLDSMPYAAAADMEIVELAYEREGRLSLMILLPNKTHGLANLERQATAANLQKWSASLQDRKVSLFLPKFKITANFDLKETLISMGMALAFDLARADFSGMCNDERLSLAAVLHKAFVDAQNEAHKYVITTAAAVATRGFKRDSDETVEFRADHPFLFMLRDKKTGSVLLLGRLANPAAVGD